MELRPKASHPILPDELEWLTDILPEVARRVAVLRPVHGERVSRDLDCAIEGLDHTWPLRLPPDVHLIHLVRSDGGRGMYWELERRGQTIGVDALDDPAGAGEYGFPTALALSGHGLLTPAPVRKAYAAAKFIRQRRRADADWHELAAPTDRAAYVAALTGVFGARVAPVLADASRNGVPPAELCRRARRAQGLRRFRHPLAAAAGTLDLPKLVVRRFARPNGIRLHLVGPDGVGKSTLATLLPAACGNLFLRVTHHHWRPGILPRPGATVRTQHLDVATPHARTLHTRIVSVGLLAYYWVDFFVGGWIFQRWTLMRSGLVVVERGWVDLEVDPARYRLRVPSRLVRALGFLLPRPDLTVLLDAAAPLVASRKSELPLEEIERQLDVWEARLEEHETMVSVDAGQSQSDVVAATRQALIDLLEQRSARWIGTGWFAFPRSNPRMWLPRGPRSTALASASLHPATSRSARRAKRAHAEVVRIFSGRALPRREAPPRDARTLIAPHVPKGGTYAVARSTLPGRFTALVFDGNGEPSAFVKLATSASGQAALVREGWCLQTLATGLSGRVRAPEVLAEQPGLLVLSVATRLETPRPHELPDEVARALGSLYASGAVGGTGPTHGDLAPWNLLSTRDGWVLADWEDGDPHGKPFADVFHFFLQSSAYIGRPAPAEIVAGLTGHGYVGSALAAYAEAAHFPRLEEARPALESYLETSAAWLRSLLDEGVPHYAVAGTEAELRARVDVLARLGAPLS
jgi:hypothetical protein